MSVLDRILERKRIDVAERRRLVPLSRFAREGTGPVRSLTVALSRPGLRFILEVKQRSPSAGLLRHDFDPVTIARSYQPVADAISVLTETALLSRLARAPDRHSA
jgi:indole-3-glycerol phosphate synthase